MSRMLSGQGRRDGYVAVPVDDVVDLETTVRRLRRQIQIQDETIAQLQSQRVFNAPDEILELRELPHAEAKTLILEYVNGHRGVLTSQIIEGLRIDPIVVSNVLSELSQTGELEGRDVNTST